MGGRRGRYFERLLKRSGISPDSLESPHLRCCLKMQDCLFARNSMERCIRNELLLRPSILSTSPLLLSRSFSWFFRQNLQKTNPATT